MGAGPLLGGLTVLELGEGIAGSVATATLALLGADVTKVVAADPQRPAHRPQLADGRPIVHALLDRSKRVRVHDAGEVADLASSADLVLEDLVDGVADPETYVESVASRNRSAWTTISPFGLTGPAVAHRGGELIAQAAGGLLATIEPVGGGRPVSPPGFVALRAVGHVAALAGLHAVERHRGTDRAVHADVSAQEAVVFTAALPECAHVLYRCPGRAGSGRYVAPSGVFPCRDGFVRIAAIEDHQWAGIVGCLGEPPWTVGLDERPARAEHAAMINERVTEWTRTQEKAACADALQRAGVPSTPVNGPSELLGSPQFEHRGFLVDAELGGARARVPGAPWVLQLTDESTGPPRAGRIGGLHVAELTHVLAGPIVGSLLGAMGADVVRVEERRRLDIYRRTGPFADGVPGVERGAYFAVANHSKRSLALEGDDPSPEVASLLAGADVVIENVGHSRLARLGVDAIEVARRLGVLVVSVSGFGCDGPLAGYRVYANNVQAYGGLALVTHDHDDRPAHLATVLADPLSSVVTATVVAAWALGPSRDRGGIVDVSMAEVVAATVGELIVEASLGRTTTIPAGNDLAPFAPHGVYRCREGRWLALAVQSDDEWSALVIALGSPPRMDRPELRHGARRFDERAALDELLDELLADRDVDELAAQLGGLGLRACPVLRGADLVSDPHLATRDFFPEIEHPDPDLGRARLVGLPWRFVGAGPEPLLPPPALGNVDVRSPSGVWAT